MSWVDARERLPELSKPERVKDAKKIYTVKLRSGKTARCAWKFYIRGQSATEGLLGRWGWSSKLRHCIVAWWEE